MITPPTIDPHTAALIRMAVREDMGHGSYGTVQGDRTVQASIPQEARSVGNMVTRKAGVVAGTFLLGPILREYQVGLECVVLVPDGMRVAAGQAIATISGGTRAILSAERVLLNFLGHLSGVATLTRRFVDAVAGVTPPPAIVDTRKTTPGYRALDKYAVRCGGGVNNRMGLYDGVMLKDNHLAALKARLGAVTLAELTARLRAELPVEVTLWLEVDTLEQLREALPGGGADIVLVDNFTPGEMREAMKLRNDYSGSGGQGRRPLIEASGGITLENVAEIAATGVERIAIGALTHSAGILDISMEFQ